MDNLLDFTTLFLDTLLPAFYKKKYKILIFLVPGLPASKAGDFLDPAPMNWGCKKHDIKNFTDTKRSF